METPLISSNVLVADLLRVSPRMVSLFIELRVGCVGCSMNTFCTLEELCRQYEMDLETFLSTIQERLNYNASY